MRDHRAGRLELFASSRPGPRGQPKKDRARALVVALRSEGRPLEQIGRALETAGASLSRTAIWEILAEAGMGRLEAAAQEPAKPAQPKTRRLRDADWVKTATIQSEHARQSIENALSAQIRAFHLDALSSQVPLAVDLDTTLSVLCDSIYRSFARRLANGYATATPDTIFRHFIATPGELHVDDDGVEVRLRPRAHTPVLLDTGYSDRTTKIPWWNDRRLTYSFPPA